MKKFEISYRKKEIVEADSFEDAAKKFLRSKGKPRDYDIVAITDVEQNKWKEVFSVCEVCDQPILEDHSYESNLEDGIDVHTSCVDPEDLKNAQEQI